MGGLSLLLMAGEQTNRVNMEERRLKSESGILSSFSEATLSQVTGEATPVLHCKVEDVRSIVQRDGGISDNTGEKTNTIGSDIRNNPGIVSPRDDKIVIKVSLDSSLVSSMKLC